LVEHGETVADVADEVQVVLDDDQGAVRLDRLQQLAGDAALLGAHAAGRLVEQQQLGLQRQRHRDFEPLLLAVAQLARQVVGPIDQPEALEQGGHLLVEGAALG